MWLQWNEQRGDEVRSNGADALSFVGHFYYSKGRRGLFARVSKTLYYAAIICARYEAPSLRWEGL